MLSFTAAFQYIAGPLHSACTYLPSSFREESWSQIAIKVALVGQVLIIAVGLFFHTSGSFVLNVYIFASLLIGKSSIDDAVSFHKTLLTDPQNENAALPEELKSPLRKGVSLVEFANVLRTFLAAKEEAFNTAREDLNRSQNNVEAQLQTLTHAVAKVQSNVQAVQSSVDGVRSDTSFATHCWQSVLRTLGLQATSNPGTVVRSLSLFGDELA